MCVVPEADEPPPPTTITQLPHELISEVVTRLVSLPHGRAGSGHPHDVLGLRLVCKLFRDAPIPEAVWRAFICALLPFAELWLLRAHIAETEGASSYHALYARLYGCKRRLEAVWTKEFRECFQTGKYSRWVVDNEEPGFVWWLIVAVRIFTVAHQGVTPQHPSASRDLVSLLRHLQTGPEPLVSYDTRNSTSASGWWQELDDGMAPLGGSAFLALFLLDAVVNHQLGAAASDDLLAHDTAAKVLDSWWGGDRREERLRALFDVGELCALAELVLPEVARDGGGGGYDGGPWAKGALNSLFWDADGLTCRGVEDCADGNCAAQFSDCLAQSHMQPPLMHGAESGALLEAWTHNMGQRLLFHRGRGPHSRQRPHLINLLALGEHASASHRKNRHK